MRTKWFSIGCFVSFIIMILVVIGSIVGLSRMGRNYSATKKSKIEQGSYLHLKLSGPIIEYNEYEDNYFTKNALDAHDLIKKINAAAYDNRIEGILLEPQMVSSGFALINEISVALTEFKAQNKPVIAFIERAGNKDYLLASNADEIYMNPSSSAGMFLNGVGSSVLFYKDLFDKIGIDINVISAGKYKGAGETYSRNEFSPFVKENLRNLFGDIYEKMVAEISINRELATDKVKYIYEERTNALIDGSYGMELGLIDQLSFREDLLSNLGLIDDKLVSLKKYDYKRMQGMANSKVAVVYLQGAINEVKGQYNTPTINFEKVNRCLDEVEKDNSIDAVVIRVNSPGGSALESEIIYNRIEKLRAKKKVVISMSNVAASGGYYISMASDHVVADPYTITGSIGVVAMFPNFSEAAEKYGINSDDVSIGKYNDFLNPFVAPNNEFFLSIKKSIDATYLEFKQRVANGRDMSLKEIEKHAQGQVWATEEAIDRNLVDSSGTLNKAVEIAAELAGVASYKVEYFPKKKDLLSEFLKDQFDIDTNLEASLLKKADKFNLKRVYDDLNQISDDPIQARLLFIGDEFNQSH